MIGQIISHYRILEKIGSGGMGEVFLAEDTKLERKVALKFLPRQLTTDKDARERFEREAKAAAALNHPNIVTIHEIGEHDDQVYIAMEYVEGRTLKDLISEHPAPSALHLMPITQVLDIALQLASGLAAAHARGIVHRDIKPQNILVDKEGRVKILDFGLAKLRGISQLTKESSTLGTVHYMSPEQTMGKDVDQRTDIWSLGVLIYEMLTGKPPFNGDYEQAVIYSILNEEPTKAAEARKDVSAEFEFILEKALAKEPEERYRHADDVLVDLMRLKKDSRPDRRQATARLRKTRRRLSWWILAAVVLLAAMAAILILVPRHKPAAKQPEAVEAGRADSIAVLPFHDYRGQKEQDYFCYNITDAVINRLAQVQNLKVRPTAAVMRYKDVDRDPQEVGKELNVGHIVSGTVQKEASRVRLTVQMIDAGSGFQEWSGTYDEVLSPSNIFSIQDKISQAVADKLKLSLSRQALLAMGANQRLNMEAYDYYSRGIYQIQYRYMISTKKEDFDDSVRMFEKAIAIDPNFWQAYIGLFWAYRHYYDVTRTGKPEDYQRALGYLEKAYQINPDDVQTQYGIGFVHFSRKDYDKWFAIARKYKDQLSSRMIYIHGLGLCFQKLGLFEQAEKYYLRSIAIDPYFFSLDNLASVYLDWGKPDRAESCYRRLLDMAPQNILCSLGMADLNVAKDDLRTAAEYLARAEKMDPRHPLLKPYRALLFAARGEKAKALAADPQPAVEIYAMLGMNDEAFAMVRKNTRDGTCIYLKLIHSPRLARLRSDPRFPDAIRGQESLYLERLRKYGDL